MWLFASMSFGGLPRKGSVCGVAHLRRTSVRLLAIAALSLGPLAAAVLVALLGSVRRPQQPNGPHRVSL